MSKITPGMVERQIQKYWSSFCSKSIEELPRFYASAAVVFGPSAERAESGPVATMRRIREYMHPAAAMTVNLGRIEVQQLGENIAIASYPYSFIARNIVEDFRDPADQILEHARATQVFELRDGTLEIVHEHMSVVMR